MKIEIKVPSMGESISEATIGTILKPSGSFVSMDDELLELETDKVNQVLFAPQAGVVQYDVSPEQVVKIGQVIGTIDSEKTAPVEQEAKEPSKPKAEAPIKQEEKKQEPKPVETPSPKPEKQAQEKKTVQEPSARFTKEDLLKEFKPSPRAKAEEIPMTPPQAHVQSERKETRKKMSKIRKLIAQKLVEVQHTTAMLTTFNEIDMTTVLAVREKNKEEFQKQYGVKLGFMSFFVTACVAAMKSVPEMNAYIDGDDLVIREYYDIGIAVSTDKGVIVPVVRDCERLSFAEIERSIASYAQKAREGGLSVDDLRGAGFTITNGGVFGSLLSTPILNPLQCGILGMHKIEKRPVVIDDEIVIRPMMYVALSYDHRIIDGKEAVTFLVHMKNCLEDPSRILLEL